MGRFSVMGLAPFIRPLPFPELGLGSNLLVAGVSPTVNPVTTLGFLGGQSTFSDGFLFVDGLA